MPVISLRIYEQKRLDLELYINYINYLESISKFKPHF